MRNKYISVIALAALFVTACEDDSVKPTLPESSAFVAPALVNPATSTPVELLPENASTMFEEFEWEKSDYGVQLSTAYVLEMDVDDTFTAPQKLAETGSSSATISVEKMNATMLALGLPGFEEATVYIRVKSTIVGVESDALYSGVVERTATTYQNSECGNFCTVGIIGSASPGGWDVDTDLRLADATRANKSIWTTVIYLNVGEVKFRAMDDWAVNWGAATFPDGTGVNNGANIPISTAGYYKVTLDDSNGAYTFTALATPEFTTVGVIGSASPGGWDADTDMAKDGVNPHVWTGTVTLTTGEIKFRAENAWDNNWGSTTYPSGYGVGNGPNIPVTVGGTYFLRFNDATGEYSVMAVGNTAPYTTVGLIGPAQSGGWDADTDLTKDPSNPFKWSKILTITEAEAKFRAENAWDVNWGASSFPSGVGLQNGNNIATKAGKYFITFNSGTGEYTFLK